MGFDDRAIGPGRQSRGWTDRQDATHGYSGGVDTGYGGQGGSGGYGPLSQGSTYAQDGSTWGRSGYGGRPGQGGGSYGQQDVGPGAQRSQWREEQRSPEFDRGRGPGGPVYDQRTVGGHEHDHEPGYIHWRNSQLERHDHDYRRWRDEQTRKYDEQYGAWRNERHEGFSRDFHEWRSRQSGGQAQGSTGPASGDASAQATGATPLTQSPIPVESVTDGRTHAQADQKVQDKT